MTETEQAEHAEEVQVIQDIPATEPEVKPEPEIKPKVRRKKSDTAANTGKAKREGGRLTAPKPEGFEQQADRMEYLFVAKQQGFVVTATVEKVSFPENIRTSLWELDLGSNIRGIVPASESGLDDPALMIRFVGQKVQVKIKSLDQTLRLAACSRREVVADAGVRLFAALEAEIVIDVVVKAILQPDREAGKPPRLLVDAGGGFLVEVPRGAATRDSTARMGSLFHPGQQLKAKVIQADRQSGLIRLNLADLEGDPWSDQYKRGEVVSGVVASQREGTVFVQVRPGMIGIAGAPLRGSLRRGDRVSATVMMFDPAQKKMHLRLRGRLA